MALISTSPFMFTVVFAAFGSVMYPAGFSFHCINADPGAGTPDGVAVIVAAVPVS